MANGNSSIISGYDEKRLAHVKRRESWVAFILFLASLSTLLTVFSIIVILVTESLPFFKTVSIIDFLTQKEWTPLFDQAQYGILPLISGTLTTTWVAMLIALPSGIIIAAYLSEFIRPSLREIIKPLLEIFAAIPTVVYGYFALLFVTPVLQKFFPELPGFNMFSAGIVMGFMIIPYVSSLVEDAMRSVSKEVREASFALGASKLETTFKVVLPAASSGIIAALILSISRALGETMIVAIAAGMQPQIAFSPFQAAQTLTAFIVQVSLGDAPHGSIGYQSIYVAGLTLFCMTLILNLIGFYFRKQAQSK